MGDSEFDSARLEHAADVFLEFLSRANGSVANRRLLKPWHFELSQDFLDGFGAFDADQFLVEAAMEVGQFVRI